MSGELGLKVAAKGRATGFGRGARSARLVRELEEADLDDLPVTRESEAPIQPLAIKTLTSRHHRLARALASGSSPSEAAFACGYTPSRVSILQGDPSFSRLVKHYSAVVEEQYQDLHQKLADVSGSALDLLQDRLEDVSDEFSNSELRDLAKLGADRTGHGPSKTVESHHTHNIAERLRLGREKIAGASRPATIEEAIIVENE